MFGFHKEGVDVIEPAIRCFRHKRTRPALKDCAMFDLPLDDRIADHTNAVGVRDPNRTFKKAALFHPGRACHFAIAVEWEPGCENRVMVILSTRVEYGDTCPRGFAFDNGG